MVADGELPIPTVVPTIESTITYEPPYDWEAMRVWLAARAIPGVELVDAATYTRTIGDDAGCGVVHVRHLPRRGGFLVTVTGAVALDAVQTRLIRVFDLDRNVSTAVAYLARDPWLARIAAAHPGLRVPGGWEPFELAVRAVLGQQVTIGAARALAAHLVRLCGRPVSSPSNERLTHRFPGPADVLDADLSPLAMPGARKATLRALAAASLDDPHLFRADRPLEMTIARLRAVPGIGDWTAHYIALRALRAADAFPASDVGLLRGVAGDMGGRPTPRALLARAEAWRPQRAYAAQLLWAEDAAAGTARECRTPNAERRNAEGY